MARETHCRKISGAGGVEAEYSVIQHPAREGFNLLTEVTEALIIPAAHVSGCMPLMDIAGLIINGANSAMGGEPEPALINEALKLDSDALANAAKSGIDAITKHGKVDLIQRILAYTKRTGVNPISGEVDTHPVAQDGIFDELYAGNYSELFSAIMFSVEVNWAPFTREELVQAQATFLNVMNSASTDSSESQT